MVLGFEVCREKWWMKNLAGNKPAFDPLATPCVTRGRAARICGVGVDAFQAYVDRVGYEPERTVGGQLLYSPAFVREAAEHFARKVR